MKLWPLTLNMETKSQTVCRCVSVCWLVSLCYLCDGRRIDRNTDIDIDAKLISYKSRNASSQTVTHRGKQFVLPLMKTSTTSRESERIVIHAMKNNTEVQVRIPNINYSKTFLMASNEAVKLNFTSNIFTSNDSKVKQNGVGIFSNNEISVCAFTQETNFSGYVEPQKNRFLVFPVTSLDHEYMLTSYPSFHGNLDIVAVYHNTTVSIELDSRVGHDNRVYTRGETPRTVLHELDTFHLEGLQGLGWIKVISDKPVAVFSKVTCGFSGVNCDQVTKQLPAVSTWDQRYIVYSTSRDSVYGAILRVVSANENTSVVFGNGVTSLLGAGQKLDHVVANHVPTTITCSPSCLVTLYATWLTCSGRGHDFCHVVPTMLTIPAINQFLPYYGIFTPDLQNGTRVLSITIQCLAKDGLMMNGEILQDLDWDSSKEGTWCGATVKVTKYQEVTTLYHQDGVTEFGVMVIEEHGGYSLTYLGGRGFDVLPNSSEDTRGNAMNTKQTEDRKQEQYKFATIGLAVLCAVMFLALIFLALRYKAKCTSKMPKHTSIEVKPLAESEYQSIRGLPRRETGNSYGYETVKPRLPPTRSPLGYLLQESNCDYENLKPDVRDSNPYLPMDEVLAEGGMTEGNEDLYLTMKKLVTTPDETTVETKEL